MKKQELITAAQKAILENAHNPAAPAVMQIWNDKKLPDIFPIAHEYLGYRLNQSTRKMQHVYAVNARQVLEHCENRPSTGN